MPSIELPPQTSTQGVALAREMAELIGRYLVEVTTDVQSSALRESKRPFQGDPGGSGPFGICPKCGVGSVVRKQKKDGGTWLQCTNRVIKDYSTCQFTAWEKDDQDAYFSGKPVLKKTYTKQAKATVTKQSPSDTVSVVPNTGLQEVFRVIEKLNGLPQTRINKLLAPHNYTADSSYVLFLNSLSPDVITQIAQSI